MNELAEFLGTILGQALSISAPVLEEVITNAIRKAFTDTVEFGGSAPDDLKQRLLERVRDANHPSEEGRTASGATGHQESKTSDV